MPRKKLDEDKLTEKQKRDRKYREKHSKYYRKYSKYYYLKKLLKNPNLNKEVYQKRVKKNIELNEEEKLINNEKQKVN